MSDFAAEIESKVASLQSLPEPVRAAGKEQIMLLEAKATELASSWAVLVCLKGAALTQLGRSAEAASLLRDAAVCFPDSAEVHKRLSAALYKLFQQTKDRDFLEEGLRYVVRAIELAPNDYDCVAGAATLWHYKGDSASALQHAKRAISLARTCEEKIRALHNIANMYCDKRLHREARVYLQRALQLDDCRVDVIADIAGCYFLEGKKREALRMAKRGLMLDPNNRDCQRILRPLRLPGLTSPTPIA